MAFITWDDPEEEEHIVQLQSGGLEKRGESPRGASAAKGDDRTEAEAAAGVLQIPVLYMRMVLLWPEGQNALQRSLARYVLPIFNLQVVVCGLGFILLEEHPNFMPPLTAAGDVMACSVLIAKLFLLLRSGPRLMEMRRELQYGFKALEAQAEPEASRVNARCVTRCRVISLKFAGFYLPLCLSAGALLVFKALGPTNERSFQVSFPRALLDCSYTFWPLFALNMGSLGTFLFFSAGYDSLFLSLCLHLSSKCDILRTLLRRAGASVGGRQLEDQPGLQSEGRQLYEFEHWNDDGSAFDASTVVSRHDMDEQLRACVRYHHMIIRLRDETEHIFAGVSLFQMLYVLIALCIPALRLLHEKTLNPIDVIFILFYFAWNFSQLLFYCWFADVLAEASQEVSVAAYAALRALGPGVDLVSGPGLLGGGGGGGSGRPVCNLSKSGGAMLRLITLRAQRPLHLTAGRVANLTLELYLVIIRKSQSIFSYLIRLR